MLDVRVHLAETDVDLMPERAVDVTQVPRHMATLTSYTSLMLRIGWPTVPDAHCPVPELLMRRHPAFPAMAPSPSQHKYLRGLGIR